MRNKETELSYRFDKFKQPFVGKYIILSSAIRGMKYSKWKVSDAFNRYVPKSDYALDERDMLLENLRNVSMSDEPNPLPENPLILSH